MSTVPSGSPNASSNGANTVKGPSELKVPTRSAAVTATKVLNEPYLRQFLQYS
jgi:hypothetical protein